MTLAARREVVELAEHARDVVQADPVEGRRLAEVALQVARAREDTEGEVAALHTLGFALYALGDPNALRTMRAAIRVGERHGHAERVALARRNLAVYLAYAGKTKASVREIEAARDSLHGIERARTEVFRISVYWLAGRGAEAVDASTPALHALRASRDSAWEARLLYNRAAVLTLLGRHGHARADLERALDLYTTLGLDAAAADVRIELAHVRFQDGDYVGCLAELDQVDVSTLSDWASCWLYLYRADALVELRLLPEVSEDLARFEERSRNAEAIDSLNQARLDGAQLALAAGDTATASAMATSARRSFAARGQTTFSSQATLITLASAAREQSVSPSSLRAGSKAARQLEADGRTLDALRGHLVLARAAAVGGYRRKAGRELAAARPLERRGTVVDRIELRYVEALQCLSRADVSRAERRLRSGLDLLEAHRSTLGAADLRATASALGLDLSRLGVSIAGASEDPANLLAWAERLRSNALRAPAASPSEDGRLRGEQDELRTLDRALQRAEKNAKTARALGSRRANLETSVRTHARLLPGRTDTRGTKLDEEAATRVLGDRALVEYVDLDGRLHAIVLSRQSLTLHDLGEVDVSTDLEWLRFALRRLARGGHDAAGRTSTLASAAAAAAVLDRMLVAPLREEIGHAPARDRPDRAAACRPVGCSPVPAQPCDLRRSLALDVARSRDAATASALLHNAHRRSAPASRPRRDR